MNRNGDSFLPMACFSVLSIIAGNAGTYKVDLKRFKISLHRLHKRAKANRSRKQRGKQTEQTSEKREQARGQLFSGCSGLFVDRLSAGAENETGTNAPACAAAYGGRLKMPIGANCPASDFWS